MRKILSLLVFSSLFVLTKSNPILAPTVFISELNFDAAGNWKLELVYIAANQTNIPIDSIFIASSKKYAKVKNYQIIGESGFIVLTKDSLNSDINLSSNGDSITLLYYLGNGFQNQKDILIFGNYPNSMLKTPSEEQSIVSFMYLGTIEYNHYSLSKSHSIGFPNEEDDMYGTIKGFAYDKNMELLKKYNLYLSVENSLGTYTIQTDSTGHFSCNIYSFKHFCNKIQVKDPSSSLISNSDIMSLNFWMDPDSVKEMDLFILDYSVVMMENITSSNNLFKLYPNPVYQNSKINYEISLPLKSTNCNIEILDANGRLINSQKISDSKGIINLPQQLHEGIFLINYKVNNRIYKTSRIIIASK